MNQEKQTKISKMNILNFNEYDKLNEHFNSNYRYENVIIEIEDIEELKEIDEYIKKKLYSLSDSYEKMNIIEIFDSLYRRIKYRPYYIRIENYGKLYQLNVGTMNFYYSQNFNFNHERLFTIEDVRNDFLMNIFKYGISTLPSYKPRKINRDI